MFWEGQQRIEIWNVVGETLHRIPPQDLKWNSPYYFGTNVICEWDGKSYAFQAFIG